MLLPVLISTTIATAFGPTPDEFLLETISIMASLLFVTGQHDLSASVVTCDVSTFHVKNSRPMTPLAAADGCATAWATNP